MVFLVSVVVFGGVGCGMHLGEWARSIVTDRGIHLFAPKPQGRADGIPTSKLPGPPRTEKLEFRLNAGNAQVMTGTNDAKNERWCDCLGNYYAAEYIRRFSYADKTADGPQVCVRIEPPGNTLKGRLEARRLKPNFAYQIKLFGDYRKDKEGFEVIGKHGRWRLPGTYTNYTDSDYKDYPDEQKHEVEAYILFDFFVTDENGNAVREFSLDSTLHVLWKSTQYSRGVPESDMVKVEIDASDPKTYARPKADPGTVWIWAEREAERYTAANQVIRLPARTYKAFLILTEESFHSYDYDGGWWATVLKTPIEFEITR